MSASVNPAMVIASSATGALRSTADRIVGETYRLTRLVATASPAESRLSTIAFFSCDVQASFIINQVACKSFFTKPPSFPGFILSQKNVPDRFGDESSFPGDEFYTCGIKISVVNAPSSLFRLIYPSRRSTMASIRTRPKPCPSPFVLRNSFPSFFSFLPAVKLVKEM